MSQEVLEKENEILNKIFIGSTKRPYDTLFYSLEDPNNLELAF